MSAKLVWYGRGNAYHAVQNRTHVAVEGEAKAPRNEDNDKTLGDAIVARALREGCWDYIEDLLKVENIADSSQAALVSAVQLTRVLICPAMCSWLTEIP
jgi:hypothetical protein